MPDDVYDVLKDRDLSCALKAVAEAKQAGPLKLEAREDIGKQGTFSATFKGATDPGDKYVAAHGKDHPFNQLGELDYTAQHQTPADNNLLAVMGTSDGNFIVTLDQFKQDGWHHHVLESNGKGLEGASEEQKKARTEVLKCNATS